VARSAAGVPTGTPAVDLALAWAAKSKAEPLPRRTIGASRACSSDLIALAQDFSPRIETHSERSVVLDISGLGSLLGDARTIGEELRRTAADRGLRVHIAVAATRTAAIVLAQARAGLTVIAPGEEAAALAPLSLAALRAFGEAPQLDRWGLRTLGDLAAIPRADLSERLGQGGVYWQRLATGEDARPLVPSTPEEPFEESLDLEWPIEGLEPLSFVLGRLCEPLCARLEQCDRGAVVLHVRLALVTRESHDRSLQLPAPMRDPRVLRTLILLDLESHPPAAAIDRLTIAVDVAEGRILQFGLFARALPAERVSTLLARLKALMGTERVGAPALVDSYRPGAFTMAEFAPSENPKPQIPNPESQIPREFPCSVLRRFRLPVPARVTLEQSRPVRVTTDRRGFSGGRVEQCAGPWRSSGNWWAPATTQKSRTGLPWDCDEWDVVLSDGAAYRISGTRERRMWFVDGVLD
jgi:protein ImuB